MIKHIVMWKLKEDHREASISEITQLFEAMQGKVNGLISLEIGINNIPNEAACDLVLYTEFRDKAALDAYQDHPDHLRIKEYVGPRRLSRHQVDYEV